MQIEEFTLPPLPLEIFVGGGAPSGEYMPIYENERGTFIFNSKDLCLLPYIPEIIKAA